MSTVTSGFLVSNDDVLGEIGRLQDNIVAQWRLGPRIAWWQRLGSTENIRPAHVGGSQATYTAMKYVHVHAAPSRCVRIWTVVQHHVGSDGNNIVCRRFGLSAKLITTRDDEWAFDDPARSGKAAAACTWH